MQIRILYINNSGAGFAKHIEVPAQTTIAAFFNEKIGGSASDHLIRVNRQPTAADYILQEGDRVSITPIRIEGAV
jgi:sulfur carrier protein ThiS